MFRIYENFDHISCYTSNMLAWGLYWSSERITSGQSNVSSLLLFYSLVWTWTDWPVLLGFNNLSWDSGLFGRGSNLMKTSPSWHGHIDLHLVWQYGGCVGPSNDCVRADCWDRAQFHLLGIPGQTARCPRENSHRPTMYRACHGLKCLYHIKKVHSYWLAEGIRQQMRV